MTGPRTGTLARLALAGSPVDGLRIVLTALSAAAATLALLLAAAVISIGPDDGPYFLDMLNDPGLRPGVIAALVLLCLPILAFGGQCARIGAPARDHRLAALRMAGATPPDVRRVAVAETGVAALVGAGLGGLVYGVVHFFYAPIRTECGPVPGPPGEDPGVWCTSGPLLPTNVVPPVWMILVCLLAVPVLSGFATAILLRRTVIGPFGLVRRVRRRPPSKTPTLLFLVGALGLACWSTVMVRLPERIQYSRWVQQGIPLLVLLTSIGLILGSASCAYLLGRVIAPRARRPAVLIAARRLVDAPFAASRTCAAVVVSVLIGAGAAGVRSNFLTAMSEESGDRSSFFEISFRAVDAVVVLGLAVAVLGLLVAAAEGVVSRRRTLAALTAAGTPRRTLAAATLLETLIPLVPTVLIAVATGEIAARGIYGTTVDVSGTAVPKVVDVPVPWSSLLTIALGTLALAALATAVSLVFLRRSTDIAELRTAA